LTGLNGLTISATHGPSGSRTRLHRYTQRRGRVHRVESPELFAARDSVMPREAADRSGSDGAPPVSEASGSAPTRHQQSMGSDRRPPAPAHGPHHSAARQPSRDAGSARSLPPPCGSGRATSDPAQQPRRQHTVAPTGVKGCSRVAKPLMPVQLQSGIYTQPSARAQPVNTAARRPPGAGAEQPAPVTRRVVTMPDACSVCKSAMQNPFEAPCGHKACMSCWASALARQACPVCSRRVQKRNLTKAYFV